MDITISGLTKTYGRQKAVDDISFSVQTGEILGFLGPNGAGKTTTLKMITDYIAPDAGEVLVGDRSMQEHSGELKRFIGYLPENNPLYLDMGVLDYLVFAAALQGVEKSVMAGRVEQMVDVCGLTEEQYKTIGELSKGYRQRVGLAQAMIHEPEILLLDEPTSGLDPNQIVEIRELIKKIGREKTVMLSTHILPEVEATCDRILIINRGKIVADGTPDTLSKQAEGQEVLHVTVEDAEDGAVIEQLSALPSVHAVVPEAGIPHGFEVQSVPGSSSRRPVFEQCVRNGWVLTRMTPLETKLEDIFRNLTMN